ncbi:MAG: aminoglycoside phosphotransferase family protein [Chloroflexi bacterium]|nr:aminoglycoside phosphotransferase family protein [Chloroflexota bacterium]
MTNPQTHSPQNVLSGTRPWAFTRSELTAGLRRFTGDPSLVIDNLEEQDPPHRRPSIGRIRGLLVECQGTTGSHSFNLVLKESQGSTRTGTAGAGLREVSVYKSFADQLPLRIPQLFIAHPGGGWLVLAQLPAGRQPEQWQAADYLLAIDQLVALHDRFWGLGEDLTIYNWLARPLDSDFSIYVHAAAAGVQNLANKTAPNILGEDSELRKLLDRLISHSGDIRKQLQLSPATLLHGEYWPGNIHVHSDGSLTIYDWEETSIGPAILDLVTFVQSSRWWFDPLPIAQEELIAHYRSRLAQATGYAWSDDDWEIQYDYALMWVFIAEWIDLLATIPNTVLFSRIPQLEKLWLKPVREAASRRMPGD